MPREQAESGSLKGNKEYLCSKGLWLIGGSHDDIERELVVRAFKCWEAVLDFNVHKNLCTDSFSFVPRG